MVTFRIDVLVDPRRATQGSKKVEKGLEGVEKRASSMADTLKKAFVAFGAVALARQLISLGDTYTTLQNQLRLVTDGTQNLADTTAALLKTANDTRGSFEATTSLYVRTSRAAEQLGRSQEEVLTVTKAINQAVAISGASAQTAAGALFQLAQGLGANALRGEELNSVLEGTPVIAQVIAKSLDTNIGGLRKLAAEGKITGDVVIDAFLGAAESLDKDFATAVVTVSGATQVLKNNLLALTGQFFESSGAGSTLASGILVVAENLETIARVALAAGVALGVDFAQKGVTAAIRGLALLKTAILTNPITLIPGLVAVAAGALVAFGDKLSVTEGSLTTVADVGAAAWDTIKVAFEEATRIIEEVGQRVFGEGFQVNFRSIADGAAILSDSLVGLFQGAYFAVLAVWDNLPQGFKTIGELALKGIRDLAEGTLDFVLGAFQTIGDVVINTGRLVQDVLRNSANSLTFLATGNLEAAQDAADAAELSAKNIALQFQNVPNQFRQNVKKLALVDFLPEVEISQGAKELGAKVAAEFDRGFREANGAQSLVDDIFDRADDAARDRAAAGANAPAPEAPKAPERPEQDLSDQNQRLSDRLDTMGRLGEQEKALNEIVAKRPDLLDEAQAAYLDLSIKALDSSQNLGDGFERAFLKMKREANDFAAVAEAAVNSFADRATEALTTFIETGEFSFRDFASAILKDITKIITRLLIVRALSSLTGGSGELVGQGVDAAQAALSTQGGRAKGGPVQPGQTITVGENGPETVRFGQTATVFPNPGQPAKQEPPQVTIVNQLDPAMFQSAIDSGELDAPVLNLIGRNTEKANRILQNQ